MKLNLGCGTTKWEGFINCDMLPTVYGTKPDVACDLRALPFRAASVSEIHAIHVWEHFTIGECYRLIQNWRRVLAPRGLLVLELPSLWNATRALVDADIDVASFRRAIYGEHGDHRWLWTAEDLIFFLKNNGMTDVHEQVAQFHCAARDMRIEARNQ